MDYFPNLHTFELRPSHDTNILIFFWYGEIKEKDIKNIFKTPERGHSIIVSDQPLWEVLGKFPLSPHITILCSNYYLFFQKGSIMISYSHFRNSYCNSFSNLAFIYHLRLEQYAWNLAKVITKKRAAELILDAAMIATNKRYCKSLLTTENMILILI